MSLFDAIAPSAARLTDAIGAATDAEANRFVRAGAPRVEYLPPVVEGSEPAALTAATTFRASHGLTGAPLIVTVISRDEPRKGLPFACATMHALHASLPEARMLVVGLEATRSNVPNGVVLAGRISDKDVAAALRAADVVFVPSLFEAFSRVVIEAWQQETPVLVSDGVALASTVSGVGGEIVPFGNVSAAASALHRLLQDDERRAAYAAGGASLVRERFLLDPLIDRTVHLYDDVAAR
jgi:glycosyltransferase involved in cell wall biosynthesis